MKYLSIAVLAAALLLLGAPAVGNAGVYHAGGALLCYDCHTMHFSMQHGWTGGAVSQPAPATGGDWLGSTGPNEHLLKAPVNELCLGCHNGTAVAPDVLEANFNAAPSEGRSAGALNEDGGATPYESWKGHSLGSMDTPPGFNGTYTAPTHGLECTQCHTQHGRAGAYRNLGPRSIPEADLSFAISTTNDLTKNVWINIASLTGTPGSRSAADWNPFYDTANIFYNRIDGGPGGTPVSSWSNGVTRVCASCHADFHGGPGDSGIGGTGTPPGGFIRHPTAGVNIGDHGGGHSRLTNFTGATTKVKVATADYAAFTNTSPICQTCHKSHGNQNPFGLIFLNRTAASVDEEGGIGALQTDDTQTGLRNLCGQCHVQGN